MVDRLAELATGERRRQVIVAVLLVTLALGSAAPSVTLSTSLDEFRGGTGEAAADNYIEANLSGGEGNVTQGLVVIRTTRNESVPRAQRDVLTKEQYLRTLRAQRALLANETVNSTLHPDQRPLSIASVVAMVAIQRDRGVAVENLTVAEPRPSLDRQIRAVENISEFELKLFTSYAVGEVLDDVDHTWPDGGGFAFVPTSYEANQKTATATAIVVSHREETEPKNLTAAQLAMGAIVDDHTGPEAEAIVVGDGIVNDELRRSSIDSLRIVGPVAALLVLLLLMFAYRDFADVVLGLLGVVMVLVWTFGYMGWANVTFNQLFVAVPVLLMGLSIDYAIHVFMRHREEREPRSGSGRRTGRSGATTREREDPAGGPVGGSDATEREGRRRAATDGGREDDTPDGDGDAHTDHDDVVFGGGATGGDASPSGGDGPDDPDDPDGGFEFGAGGGGDDSGDGSGDSDRDTAALVPSMRVALGGVGAALALVTLTTATGFLSNLASGVGPIREFGVVSAVGIVAAFVVFGLFVPALKVEVDAFLESRGRDRRMTAFATEGRLKTFLAVSIAAARSTPWGVIALALLATAGGVFGATQVENRFEQDDLLVDDGDVPPWTDDLPEAAQPTNYTAQDRLDYVEDSGFVYDGTLTQILVRGDVTEDETLERVQRASDAVNDTDVALVFPNKNPGTRGPTTMMRTVAETDEAFNETFQRADTDDNGVPDRNLGAVYDAFFEAAPDAAATVVHRVDGEYVALRIRAPVNGTATEGHITRDIRNATAPVQGQGLRATATGQPVKNQAVAAQLLDTVVTALAITLAVVLVLLVISYRRSEGYASLGAVTLLPVAFAVAWILGTMWLLGIPFNVMTALITSFTIGIGVDYSIHVSERYVQELDRGASMSEAIEISVLGTGGALLGSAVTDVFGVGVLVFAILEPLQQFGAITALTIAYSFLASVVVLPSLLVVWTRRWGPQSAIESSGPTREPMSVDD